MNLFADISQIVIAALEEMAREGTLPEGLDLGNVTVEPPRDPAHGDMATNAAMVLAKPARMKPRDIADALSAKLDVSEAVASCEVAGPGFINLRLTDATWARIVPAILSADAAARADAGDGPAFRSVEAYGRSRAGAGRKVNVEYVSANPTGPLHVGHTRGAVFGDALASLLDFAGWEVTREYYINDGGAQVDVLARSAYERYREAHGLEPQIADGLYPGDYLIPVGEALKAAHGDALLDRPEADWLPEVRSFAMEAMIGLIRDDLAALGVHMDRWFSEKSLYGTGRIEAALSALDAKGLIYEGVLAPPKGKAPEDWEPREQTLFRSTAHGDDVDRPVRKSDGGWTYFAPDIAYHFDKVERGYDLLIDVFGADHGGYVKRMKAAVAALSDARVPLDVKLTQLVHLWNEGEPFKMSKRAGTFVTLRDVIDMVGPDVTRFTMLTRKNDAPLDFHFDKVREQSKDNPVFYVQYAHARVQSVLSKAAVAPDPDGSWRLTHPAERELIARLAEFPRLVEQAADAHEPHRLAFYLYDLAGSFHALWNRGNDEPGLRFILEDDPDLTAARLAMIRAVAVVIATGLGILGVAPMDEMR